MSLSFSKKVAFRYLWSKRSEAFITIITVISVVGVAVGVMVLNIVMAVMTGFESELGSPYTAVTLAFLRKRYPATRFVWVMGADNLAQFHRWQDWEDIARSWPIAVIDRPGWRLEALAAQGAQSLSPRRLPEAQAASLARCRPPVWSFLTSRLSPLSSTALRAEAAAEHKAAALPRRTVPLKRG